MTSAAPGVSATTSWRPLHEVRRVWTRYVGSDDPRVGAANLVAMVLAWNTPFYPLYLRGTAGAGMWPGGWLMLCVFPAFLAVPALTRRWPTGGRVLLVTIGTANTLFCTWLLGEASGTPLFLLPCVTLACVAVPARGAGRVVWIIGDADPSGWTVERAIPGVAIRVLGHGMRIVGLAERVQCLGAVGVSGGAGDGVGQ